MKQVVQNFRSGRLRLLDVPAPGAKPGHLLVATRASLISAGTERMVTDLARKSLIGKARARPDLVKKVIDKARRDGIMAAIRSVTARLDEPLPLGYSAVGTVVEIGAGLEGRFRTGERVAIAGAGLANHAEMNVVPGNLAAPVPDAVSDEEACFGTLATIAMHAVRNMEAGLGDVACVIGAGLVGQLAIRLLSLAGVRVIAIDYDPARLKLAERMGAEATFDAGDATLAQSTLALTQGRGCDRILIAAATSSSEPFQTAGQLARDRARVVLVGLTGTEFPYKDFMQKELTVQVSRSYGPGRYDADFESRGIKYPPGFVRWTETDNLAESLRLMAPGPLARLDVTPLITHRFDINEAETAYQLVTEGEAPHMGVVLTYREPAPAAAVIRPAFTPSQNVRAESRTNMGVIGAGGFARTMLLPALKSEQHITLHTIVSQRGANAEHGQNAFGFKSAATDAAAVLDNPDIGCVLIATRHDTHADLTARALDAGKPVLVEKPLALTVADLNRVIAARNDSHAFFQFGFNRRFAPMVREMKSALDAVPGPRFVVMRVNAGAIDADSWIQHPGEGGGRILGEACHFIDLARHLVGAAITSVGAEAALSPAATADDAAITLRFADGSLAVIAYTALGDSALSKERIEVSAGGRSYVIDNFLTFTKAEGGRITTRKAATQDKGVAGSVAAFSAAVHAGGPAPIDEAELIEVSAATLLAMDSLRRGIRLNMTDIMNTNTGREATSA